MALNNNNSSNLKNNETDEMKHNKLVVRVDQDSDNNLQALFDSVLKPSNSNRPLQVPYRMRDLPESFFNPPATGSKSSSACHSRENSADSAFSNGSTIISGSKPMQPVHLQISHSRAHSSPATLQQTYAGLNQNNNNTNASSGGSNGQAQAQSQQTTPIQHIHMKQRSYDVVSAVQLQKELGDLPPGWEQARTELGQIYYINHTTRTTQWEDPRKQLLAQQQNAIQQQQSAESLIGSQQNLQQQNAKPLPEGWQEAVTSCGSIYYVNHTNGTTSWFDPRAPNIITKLSPSIANSLGPLPEGWEQALTSAGETYFINHINRTTSWFDPRIPEELQRPRDGPAPSEMANAISSGWLNNHAQNLRQLERERELMRQRQQEIRTQDLIMRQNQQAMEQQVDPFLSGTMEHTRQASGDSGLSLSSNNVSIPHNSDFLLNINDNMDCLSECGNLDSIGASEETLIDTDDLMSSFQLTEDLLRDVNLIDHTTIRTNPKWP